MAGILSAYNGVISAAGSIIAASGDTTGVTDSNNINNAITAGAQTITLGKGTFTAFNILPASNVRITGQGRGVTTINNDGSHHIFDIGNSQTDTVEIDHMTLNATGADIFSGTTANCIRWFVHDCNFIQNSAGNAIWNGQIPSGGPGVMIECRFRGNEWNFSGAVRTIEACLCVGDSGANAVNQNSWEDEIFFNNGADSAMYNIRVTATTQTNSSNSFRNIVFEHPYGGMIKLESHAGGLIDHCIAWDLTNNVVNDLIHINKSSGGSQGIGNTIRNSPRNSTCTFTGSAKDIVLDANAPQTMILNARWAGSGTGLLIDCGNSVNCTVSGLPGTYTLANAPGVLKGVSGRLDVSTDSSGGTYKPLAINGSMELFRARSGSLAQTLPRILVTSTTAALTTSGTVYLVGITIPSGTVVSNITTLTGTGTLKTGGTHGWYILCDNNRVVRAATADQTDASTVWGTASTEYQLAIATAGGGAASTFTTTYSGLYYVGVMVANSAGSQPNLCSSATQVAGIGLAPILSGATTTTAQTTPPLTDGSVTIGTIANDSTKFFYFWLS